MSSGNRRCNHQKLFERSCRDDFVHHLSLNGHKTFFNMLDAILQFILCLRMQPNHFYLSEKHNSILWSPTPAPRAFSHRTTTCDFATLAKYIFSNLLLLPVMLTGEGVLRRWEPREAERRCEIETWGNSCREKVSPCGGLSVHQAIVLSVFLFSPHPPLRFLPPTATRWEFSWINVINTTPFSHYQSWPTFWRDSLNEMCKVIL